MLRDDFGKTNLLELTVKLALDALVSREAINLSDGKYSGKCT
jgi:hypothetical protein